ncbi:MAG: efflux RND transporter periplasmic adaptor subunit [Bryobacteraceae bacterium]|nr:efflux RND transporter periplasmic adaptor subunit [Bryobacteraceae bacterium]
MNPESQPTSQPASAPPVSGAVKTGGLILAVVAACGLGLLIVKGIQTRLHAETALQSEARADSAPIVSIVHPKLGAPTSELMLPGSVEAFVDTPVYARTNGYLKRWYFDIGARVAAGQLLAEIETPEVDQQLSQTRAELNTARANYELSRSTAERWQFLLKTDSVSRQETDEKLGDLRAKQATLDAAAANVKRLEETQSFQKVYAPFAGVITARNIDIGALINAGSSGVGKELFHLAAISRLRVFVAVPQANSASAAPGAAADVTLAERPGRVYHGRLARTANSIEPASRTLRVEVDVDNPDGSLLPGSYVQVHLKLPGQTNAVTVPVSATLFRSEGLNVAAVRDGHVALVPISVGRDYGDELEVISGLRPEEALIVNPPDALVNGQAVRTSERSRDREGAVASSTSLPARSAKPGAQR